MFGTGTHLLQSINYPGPSPVGPQNFRYNSESHERFSNFGNIFRSPSIFEKRRKALREIEKKATAAPIVGSYSALKKMKGDKFIEDIAEKKAEQEAAKLSQIWGISPEMLVPLVKKYGSAIDTDIAYKQGKLPEIARMMPYSSYSSYRNRGIPGYPAHMYHENRRLGRQFVGGFQGLRNYNQGYSPEYQYSQPWVPQSGAGPNYEQLMREIPRILSKQKKEARSRDDEMMKILKDVLDEQKSVPTVITDNSERMIKDIISDTTSRQSPAYQQQDDLAKYLAEYAKLTHIYKVNSDKLEKRMDKLGKLLSQNTQVPRKDVDELLGFLGPLIEKSDKLSGAPPELQDRPSSRRRRSTPKVHVRSHQRRVPWFKRR